MANRKKTKQAAERSTRKNKRIQITGVVVLVLVVVLSACQSPPESTDQAVVEPTLVVQSPIEAPQVSSQQYAAAPPMSIEVDKQYIATLKLAKGGEIVIELYPEEAPITVNSFVFLSREGFFDGLTFHRVLADFMAQAGDPTGTGGGGPGYQFVNEESDLLFDKAGVLAMANAGRDTNGSQFFITYGPQEFLDGGYTIFGQVIEGMEIALEIRTRDPNAFPDYTGDVIESITIEEK
ncbi:MAG: peptidylprolyl isomerase [Anaerolineae bacterium]|nr:peptidylprolyl isomerase [Anaerolineae bacterium]